ncbi:serine/threonine-protein kinase [Nannocystaceae bacterium ST9]
MPTDDHSGPEQAERIGRFRVRSQIGVGGNAIIYAAWDDENDREVAIKLLRDDRSFRPDTRARFLREAKAMARLHHPNVVRIYEVGIHGGPPHGEARVFLAMEYVEGQSLREWVERESPSIDAILARYIEAGRGLAAAHAAGLMHRDFKPDNAVLGSDGHVRVVDFGLARSTRGTDSFQTIEEMTPGLRAVLDQGADILATIGLSGTPAYMALEQHFGRDTDARADQFAFCVATWEALFGQRPYRGQTAGAIARAIELGKIAEPARERASGVPKSVRKALERGLAAEAKDRWPTMDLLLAELEDSRRSKGLLERFLEPFRRE